MTRTTKGAIEDAQKLLNTSGRVYLVAALMGCPLLLSYIFRKDVTMAESLLSVSTFIVAFAAAAFGLGSMQMAAFQMQQAEEHRSTDAALAEAMADLANELRRRPEVSPSVTLALFATSKIQPASAKRCESDFGGREFKPRRQKARPEG